jgi:kynurenine formamidase
MLRRVVDVSLTVAPQPGAQIVLPGRLPQEIEPSGKGRPRKDIQQLCLVAPYQIGNDIDDTGMDVTLGDSLPHTHAESLWINQVTVLDELPSSKRWVVRDIASIPAAEFTGEAAVIDVSGEDKVITAAMLAKHGRHVRHGDFVLLRTDYHKKFPSLMSVREMVRDSAYLRDRPGLTMGASEWLVRDRQIVGLAADVPGGLAEPHQGPMSTHTYFYVNAVLMIDEMVNFDELPDDRVYFSGGVALRMAGIGSSPARAVGLPLDGSKWTSGAIDMFHKMEPTEGGMPKAPFSRIEPAELRSDLYKRYDITWLQIAFETDRGVTEGDHGPVRPDLMADRGPIRPQRDMGSPVRSFSTHLGTHLLYTGEPLTNFLISACRILDLTGAGPRHTISLAELKAAASMAGWAPGEGVVLRTAFSDHYYHRPDYLYWTPGIAPEAIRWLAAEGTPIVVTDALALDAGYGSSESRRARFETNLPVVLGASRLWMARKNKVEVITSPVPLPGLDAYPSRVVLIETW